MANDALDTQFLTEVDSDWSNGSSVFSLEASRRIGEHWKASLEARAWVNTSPRDWQYSWQQDDFVQATLFRYF